MKLKYKRVLLKISGEALMGDESFGIDPSTVVRITKEIQTVVKQGVEAVSYTHLTLPTKRIV